MPLTRSPHRPHPAATAGALICAAAVAGCGLGSGEQREGEASLTVTRDYGAERMLSATASDPPESETVVRFLEREAEIETSYGGNFVDAIDGVDAEVEGGRSRDWFFYVNGYWSPVGAGEAPVRPGDRIWWDFRDWTDAYRVSAVVGSWPEPFLHGLDGETPPVRIECWEGGEACAEVERRLEAEGVAPEAVRGSEAEPDGDLLRVLVGPWSELRADRTARAIEAGPDRSGVYARPLRCDPGGWRLAVLGDDAGVREVLEDAGFVAALARGDDEPVWVVSATGAGALGDAVALLDSESLADRYAVASTGGEPLPIPSPAGEAEAPLPEECA